MHITLDARYLDSRPGSTYAGGGVALYVAKLMEQLRAQEPSLRLRLVVRPGGSPLCPDDPRVEEVPFDAPAQSVQTLATLSRRVPTHDTDLFHAPANVLPFGLRCPTVATVHDLMWLTDPRLCAPFPLKRWLTGAYYQAGIRHALSHATRLLTVSQASADAIARFAPARAADVRVTHNALDPFFSPTPLPEAEALTADIVPPNTPFVLVVGQGAPYKNHLRAVQAFAHALGGDPNWKLVLIRRFSRIDRDMTRLLNTPAIARQVIARPQIKREALRALYSRAAVFLFPSLCEGFGLPLLEAMACGAPVVTSTHPAPVEVTADAALHADPTSVEDIAGALRLLADDPSRRLDLKARGLQRAQTFSWADTARKTLAVYHEALQ
jgi:glycosyltransferase involved in cell wall biosynthesis